MSGRSTGGLWERLEAGPVIGDGGMLMQLEKRGYVKAGNWTPEAVIEHPEAVAQLHREFVRAGSDVCQAFTFYASESQLDRAHGAGKYGVRSINIAACEIAKAVAKPAGCLVAGGLSQTNCEDRETATEQFKEQLSVFKDREVDVMFCEYFEYVEEAVWAIEAVRKFMPDTEICATVALTTPEEDADGVAAGDCGVRLVQAGADVVGVNCHFDPLTCIESVKKMITAVRETGMKAHFMVQPLGAWTADAGKQGWVTLPEMPFAMEPRIVTRFDMARYAREAYNAGIRYLGGCCMTEPYHIRAVSEELREERGGYQPENCTDWGACLAKSMNPETRAKVGREFWENLTPKTGRPESVSE